MKFVCDHKGCTTESKYTVTYGDPWDFENSCEKHLGAVLLDCFDGYDVPKDIVVTKLSPLPLRQEKNS